MSKKITKEEYIEKAKKIYGDRYNYEESVINGIDNSVTFFCEKHGYVTQNAGLHLKGVICKFCSKEEREIKNCSKGMTRFLKQAKEIHGEKYTYEKVLYTTKKEKFTITCPLHGYFYTLKDNFIGKKSGCPECGFLKVSSAQKNTQEDFIKCCEEKHNYKYDYSLVEYETCNQKISIICPVKNHGLFEQQAMSHKKGTGCPLCSSGYQRTHEQFLNSIFEVHGDTYDYSKTIYVNAKSDIIITCKIHGDFPQKASNHLWGKGCPKCAHKKVGKINGENPTGWTAKEWKTKAERSKNFENYKVYIIRCFNETESFYKIGKTFLKLKGRFTCKTTMPYQYEVTKLFESDDPYYICDLEHELHRKSHANRYQPLIPFNGQYECFSEVNLIEKGSLEAPFTF